MYVLFHVPLTISLYLSLCIHIYISIYEVYRVRMNHIPRPLVQLYEYMYIHSNPQLRVAILIQACLSAFRGFSVILSLLVCQSWNQTCLRSLKVCLANQGKLLQIVPKLRPASWASSRAILLVRQLQVQQQRVQGHRAPFCRHSLRMVWHMHQLYSFVNSSSINMNVWIMRLVFQI